MEKAEKSIKETTVLELIFRDEQDLKNLSSEEEFVTFIINDSLNSIKNALENNLDRVELFNIFNLSLSVELEKLHYKDVLNKITQFYIEQENYEICNNIQKIIKKYEI
tara:strand:- start:220 stop:543 length:324 start_codon:yes stop_codon:yes gene_type:complete